MNVLKTKEGKEYSIKGPIEKDIDIDKVEKEWEKNKQLLDKLKKAIDKKKKHKKDKKKMKKKLKK